MLSNSSKGILAILGCLLVDISVGEYNLLSFLYPYFGSYFHYKDNTITVDNTPIIGAIWLAIFIFSGVTGVAVNSYFGYKLTFFIFMLIFGVGQFLSSYVSNFWLFALAYALPGGTAQGALTVLPLYCAWRYFPDNKKPLISGIILSAYALAPILSSFISQRMINPDNIDVIEVDGQKYFPQDIADRTPNFIRTFACISFVLGTIGILMIIEPTVDDDEGHNDSKEEIPQSLERLEEQDLKEKIVENDVKPKKEKIQVNIRPVKFRDMIETFKDPIFWHVFFCIFIGLIYVHFISFSFKKIGLNHMKQADQFINIAGSIASFFNAGSRLVSGLSLQRYGFAPVAYAIMITQILCSVCFIKFADNKIGFTICLSLSLSTYGAQLGAYPLLCQWLYEKKGALVYMMAFWGFCIGAVFVSLSIKRLLHDVGETNLFYSIAFIPLLSTYSILVLHRKLDEVTKIKKRRDDKSTNDK